MISFDESLNDSNQKCQMDLIVRSWDCVEQRSRVRYWETSYLGHSTHTDLLDHFNKSVGTLDPSKMVQVSMDGPSVNHKFYKKFSDERSDSEISALVDIGSCSLHIVNGAFQSGAEKSELNIKIHLRVFGNCSMKVLLDGRIMSP